MITTFLLIPLQIYAMDTKQKRSPTLVRKTSFFLKIILKYDKIEQQIAEF